MLWAIVHVASFLRDDTIPTGRALRDISHAVRYTVATAGCSGTAIGGVVLALDDVPPRAAVERMRRRHCCRSRTRTAPCVGSTRLASLVSALLAKGFGAGASGARVCQGPRGGDAVQAIARFIKAHRCGADDAEFHVHACGDADVRDCLMVAELARRAVPLPRPKVTIHRVDVMPMGHGPRLRLKRVVHPVQFEVTSALMPQCASSPTPVEHAMYLLLCGAVPSLAPPLSIWGGVAAGRVAVTPEGDASTTESPAASITMAAASDEGPVEKKIPTTSAREATTAILGMIMFPITGSGERQHHRSYWHHYHNAFNRERISDGFVARACAMYVRHLAWCIDYFTGSDAIDPGWAYPSRWVADGSAPLASDLACQCTRHGVVAGSTAWDPTPSEWWGTGATRADVAAHLVPPTLWTKGALEADIVADLSHDPAYRAELPPPPSDTTATLPGCWTIVRTAKGDGDDHGALECCVWPVRKPPRAGACHGGSVAM